MALFISRIATVRFVVDEPAAPDGLRHVAYLRWAVPSRSSRNIWSLIFECLTFRKMEYGQCLFLRGRRCEMISCLKKQPI